MPIPLTTSLGLACIAALLARIGVFLYFIANPMTDESGFPVSPMLLQGHADYPFYLQSLAIYQGSLSDLVLRITNSFHDPFTSLYGFVTSGPILPMLLLVFQYSVENTLPLSIASLTVGTITAWLWIAWLHGRGVSFFGLVIFALLLAQS
jgi:hypothetical protein